MVSKTWKNYNKYFCQNCKDRNWIVQCSCGQCEQTFTRIKNRHNIIRKYVKGHTHLKGSNHRNFNGYQTITTHGYRKILINGEYIPEHRYLFEQYHQCSLLPWADVHHKNGNKLDNSKKNLEGMTHIQHSRLHNNVNPNFSQYGSTKY